MPRRSSHVHALQRDSAPLQALAPEVDKRIVTIYTALSSSDAPSASFEEGASNAQGIDINNRVRDLSPLPTAISSAMIGSSDVTSEDVPLVEQTLPSSASSIAITPTATMPVASSTGTAAATSQAPAFTKSTSSSSSNDVATKAGIALGVLGGLFVILAFVYCLIVRRKKQLEAQRANAADNEKPHASFRPLTLEPPARPPRLSLRPMTRPMTGLFNFNNGSHQGNGLATRGIHQGTGLAARAAPPHAARPTTSNSSNASDNPFSNKAQISEDGLASTPVPSASVVTLGSATMPFLLTKDLPRSPPRSVAEVSPMDSEDNMPIGIATSNFPTGHLTGTTLSVVHRQPSERRQSVRQENVPAPLDLTVPPMTPTAVPPSPSGTVFSMAEIDPDQTPYHSAGAASIEADGGPRNTTVHRVQLDFKPTLDDELELQAGQLVRLLHEYDDGWALCIRLDRSQQGVVPRSCLSMRPVKPRLSGHRGPPVNPQGAPRSNGSTPGPRLMGPPTGKRGPSPMDPGPGLGGWRPDSPNEPGHQPTHHIQQDPPPTSHLPGQAY